MHTTQDYPRILHNTYFCNVKNKLSRGWKKSYQKMVTKNQFSSLEIVFQMKILFRKILWIENCLWKFDFVTLHFSMTKINSQTQSFFEWLCWSLAENQTNLKEKKIITKLTLLKSKWKRKDTFTPKCRQKMHKSLTTGNFQRDFLPGGFFCQEILEDRHGGDVVRFEYRLSLSVM